MKTLFRKFAFNPRYYDRATTVCLIVGVGAALVYEQGFFPAWLSYTAAGTAVIASVSLYFYRRMANSVSKDPLPVADPERSIDFFRQFLVGTIAASDTLAIEVASGRLAIAYYTLGRQIGTKIHDRAAKRNVDVIDLTRTESYLLRTSKVQARHLLTDIAWSHALSHSPSYLPLVGVKQKVLPVKKPVTDTSSWPVVDFDPTSFGQHLGFRHVTP